jgi:hypothetical protein
MQAAGCVNRIPKWDELPCLRPDQTEPYNVRGKPNHDSRGEIILREIDQVLRSKELELSQVEIEVQSLRIVAELLGEEVDQEEARKLADASIVRNQR